MGVHQHRLSGYFQIHLVVLGSRLHIRDQVVHEISDLGVTARLLQQKGADFRVDELHYNG